MKHGIDATTTNTSTSSTTTTTTTINTVTATAAAAVTAFFTAGKGRPAEPISPLRRQSGFSLVELMVGMTIGLLTVLVVVNVLGVADARRRTTTSGADAVTNAQLALYSVERDGKSAGYGMTTVKSALGCAIRGSYKSTILNSKVLAPAQIVDGAAGAPDQLAFFTNQRADIALPTRIVLDHAQMDSSFFIQSDLAARTGDLMLAVPADPAQQNTWCTAFAVTSVVPGANRVMHDGPSDWNVAVTSSLMPANGYQVGDYLLNLGRFAEQRYDIDDGALRLQRLDLANNQLGAAAGAALYSGIVQLQAVYGKDTDANGVVDVWNAIAPVGVQWQQVIAVRLAMVARSQKREPEVVTLDGASTCANPVPPAAALCWRPDPNGNAEKIDVSATAGSNWQHYRYQVLDTTIPVRNTIWQQ